MTIKLGNEQFTVNFDEQNNTITVDGVTVPVVQKYGYTYKCYKHPKQIGADGGIVALKKFFQDDLFICNHIAICKFVKGRKNV